MKQENLFDEIPITVPQATPATPTRQQVECVWCKWRGDSPVKKFLREPGRDYPLECRQCHAVGLRPVDEGCGLKEKR